jgi:NAD+ kinase
MPKVTPHFQRIAIARPEKAEAPGAADDVARALKKLGAQIVGMGDLQDEALRSAVEERKAELLIVLGGDGSMLHAGHLCGPYAVPILGINWGHFGFLTELRRSQWREYMELLMEGDFRLEDRMMLRASHKRGDLTLGTWDVLNEVVVCRGQVVRPLTLRACVDGYMLADYVADGLIAATPTGSTAYALAAGGPILPPEVRNILIIPLAPHLSLDRAVILPEGSCVTITALSDIETVFSIDGQKSVLMQKKDSVHVAAGEFTVKFIRFQDPGYFYRNLGLYLNRNPTGDRQ